MARGGFLGRIGRAIRNVVAPSPRPSEPPREQPPPSPPEPTTGSYRQAWRELHGKGSFRKHRALFHKHVDKYEEDPNVRRELWDSYVKHIASGESRARRNVANNPFWRESGIHPADFDWRAFRIALGYKRKGD